MSSNTSEPGWTAIAILVGRLILLAFFVMAFSFKFMDINGWRAISPPPASRSQPCWRGWRQSRGAAGRWLPDRRLFRRGLPARRTLRDFPGLCVLIGSRTGRASLDDPVARCSSCTSPCWPACCSPRRMGRVASWRRARRSSAGIRPRPARTQRTGSVWWPHQSFRQSRLAKSISEVLEVLGTLEREPFTKVGEPECPDRAGEAAKSPASGPHLPHPARA